MSYSVRGWCEVSVPAPGDRDQYSDLWDLRYGSGHTLGTTGEICTNCTSGYWDPIMSSVCGSEKEYCAHWYTLMSQLETAGHWPSTCSWWQHSGHKSLPGYKAPPGTPQLRASLPPILSHNSPWWPPVVPRPGPGGHHTDCSSPV